MKLDRSWMRELHGRDWTVQTAQSLYTLMDKKLEVQYTPLRHLIELFSSFKLSNTESPRTFLDRVEIGMTHGGIGTKEVMNLNWDRLLTCLVIKG